MADGFVCSYSDILYRPAVVRRALEHEGDIALCVDTDWRTRYVDRSQHPEDDAEKIVAEGDRVVAINRAMPGSAASGEYIGVARFDAAGARSLRAHYQRVKAKYAGQTWKYGTPFEKAYLIHLFEEMLDAGSALHMVTTDGEYMEIDTEEDVRAGQCALVRRIRWLICRHVNTTGRSFRRQWSARCRDRILCARQ